MLTRVGRLRIKYARTLIEDSSPQMRLIQWMCEYTRLDKTRNEVIKESEIAPTEDRMRVARER